MQRGHLGWSVYDIRVSTPFQKPHNLCLLCGHVLPREDLVTLVILTSHCLIRSYQLNLVVKVCFSVGILEVNVLLDSLAPSPDVPRLERAINHHRALKKRIEDTS